MKALRPSILILAIGAFAFSLGYIAFPHDEASHAAANDYADLALDPGVTAPDLDVAWLDGTALAAKDLEGKIVVVDFWATWCAPCLSEVPHYNELSADYADKDVQLLGVTLQSGTAEQVREWIDQPIRLGTQEFSLEYPVAMGNDAVETAWGPIYGFPMTYLVDHEWKIRKKWLGAVPDKSEQLRVLIDRLIAERDAATDD